MFICFLSDTNIKLFSFRVLFDLGEFGILEVLDARAVRPYIDGIKNNRVG